MHLMLATVAEWKSVYGNWVRGNPPSFPHTERFPAENWQALSLSIFMS